MDNLHVMIVDDEETIRSVYAQVVTEDGYRVSTAANGEAALELIGQDEAQIVITDINMGQMNGIALLRAIKKINANIQVIMLTGQTTVDLIIEALRFGAFDYLVKPVDELELISNCVNRAAEKFRSTPTSRAALNIAPLSEPPALDRTVEGEDYAGQWLGGEN